MAQQALGVATVLLLPLVSGCMLKTEATWKRACDQILQEPVICGIIQPPGDQRSLTPSLVVSYMHVVPGYDYEQGPRMFYTTIPLTNTLAPPSPFRYTGAESSLDRAAQTLDARQRQSISSATFDIIGPDEGKRLLESPAYCAINTSQDGIWTDETSLLAASPTPHRYWCYQNGVKQEYIVFLPWNQTRPAKDVAAAKRRAALLAPANIIIDVVLTPVYFFQFCTLR